MKTVFVIILTVVVAAAIPVEENRQSSESGWYVPQADGALQWMTVEEAEQLRKELDGRVSAAVYFYLYTKKNPTTEQPLVSGNINLLKASNFDSANPTKIIIHGWKNNRNSELNIVIRNAFLSKGHYNVIVVDWSDKADSPFYPISRYYVSDVGQQVAGFIDFLYNEGGLSFDTLHVIGHSLGAHVSGFAGKNVKYGRIHQITGLDPAYPLFSYDKPAERLNKFDASYVESVQTSGDKLGFLQPIGASAYYPNGGRSQPGCGLDFMGTCAHGRSFLYYAEAIGTNNFPAMKCENYKNAVQKSCGTRYSLVCMAAASSFANVYGSFYVPVNDKAPYGMGQ